MLNLSAPVETLKGIGSKTAESLKKFGITTVRDFFYNLPRTYDNYQNAKKIRNLRPGKVVIAGEVVEVNTRQARSRRLSITEAIIKDDTGSVRAIWFNQPYRASSFKKGEIYFFTGTYELKNGRYQLSSPKVAKSRDITPSRVLRPVYVAHGGLKSDDFVRLMEKSRPLFADIPPLLPPLSGPVKINPKTRAISLYESHFPDSAENIAKAHNYLAFEELFEYILAARLSKIEATKLKAPEIPINLPLIREFIQNLPFTPTNAQKIAAWEIFQDMNKPTPMNRLLQGDVGSGKTLVAALAVLNATSFLKSSHLQAALLAPTAVLAAQHYETLSKLLAPYGVKTALLTGSTKKKPELKAQIAADEINLVIGTHALLTDDTEFKDLALVIIDEQHRFGVNQRQRLLLKSPKNQAPHLLSMTATPIPRSLQLTVFGDLDVSVLNEMPPGRTPVKTEIIPEIAEKSVILPKIAETLKENHQIYWICRAIDDNPRSETASIKTRTEKLKKYLGPNSAAARAFGKAPVIEFLHGRMKPAEKDEIMTRFAKNEIQILVSTTVVEVGVDVPNASLIVIENADNYGLAALHQLRGRVGRGKVESTCFLMTSGDNPPTRRLRELEKSSDGFYLAEKDLEFRGPGEIYGALQHGALDLRIASFSDLGTIKKARAAVDFCLKTPNLLTNCPELMDNISKYQKLTTLN